MPKDTVLNADDLIRDPDLQARAGGLDSDHADDIARAVKQGQKLPRVQVREVTLEDGSAACYVVDGFHTIEGHLRAGRKMVPVTVKPGTWQDAVLDAAAANAKHLGLKRTNADKRRAVEMVMAIHPDWTSRRLAEHCKVSHNLVESVREQLALMPVEVGETKRVGKDGKARKLPKKVERAEAATEDEGWRSLPLNEGLNIDQRLLDSLGEEGVKTAGDLARAIESKRYPNGKRVKLSPVALDVLLGELSQLTGYDGPQPKVAHPHAAQPENGAVAGFDWRKWETHYGPVARSIDDIARVDPQGKKSAEFREAQELLSRYAQVMQSWRDRLTQKGQ